MRRLWNCLDRGGKAIAVLAVVSVVYFTAQVVRFFV